MKTVNAGKTGRLTERKYGSDYIVDVLREYGIPYAAFNPGATFRGIHDSLVNYLGNNEPEIIECTHEEISVAIAHGYAKATGKPLAAIVHNIVGLQHATMAIYNAWCDRVPVIVLGGTGPMSYPNRRPGMDWTHTALVQGNQVRDYVKWDDQPADLESVPESIGRAYQLAMTEPTGPVYVCFDAAIQEAEYEVFPPLPNPSRLKPASGPTAPMEVIERIAGELLRAENPVIIADRLGRSAAAYDALEKLADMLMIPVLDQETRHNFPTNHPLALAEIASEVIADTDYILVLDTMDLYGALHTFDKVTRRGTPLFRPSTHITHVTLDTYLVRSWSHDSRRLMETDDLISADTSVFVPDLLEKCREMMGSATYAAAKQKIEKRSRKWEGRLEKLRAKWLARAQQQNEEEPVALSTLALIVWNVIKDEPWVLANGGLNRWVHRLWDIEKQDQYMGKHPGGGLGYGIGASIGVAMGLPDRLCINLQGDGDFLFTSNGLWTAVHHRIPLLTIIVNNRSYYNSEEHCAKVAGGRKRPVENAFIGNRIEDPLFDFAKLAQSMGAYGEGPVLRSTDIEPALRRALAVMKKERRPALVDIVTQNR